MTKQIRKWFWMKVAEWKYRKHGYNEVCCCGDEFIYHPIYLDMPKGFIIRIVDHSQEGYWRCKTYDCPSRCAKEYAVTSYVEGKLKGEDENV